MASQPNTPSRTPVEIVRTVSTIPDSNCHWNIRKNLAGLVVQQDNGILRIKKVFQRSPAARQGICSGDRITRFGCFNLPLTVSDFVQYQKDCVSSEKNIELTLMHGGFRTPLSQSQMAEKRKEDTRIRVSKIRETESQEEQENRFLCKSINQAAIIKSEERRCADRRKKRLQETQRVRLFDSAEKENQNKKTRANMPNYWLALSPGKKAAMTKRMSEYQKEHRSRQTEEELAADKLSKSQSSMDRYQSMTEEEKAAFLENKRQRYARTNAKAFEGLKRVESQLTDDELLAILDAQGTDSIGIPPCSFESLQSLRQHLDTVQGYEAFFKNSYRRLYGTDECAAKLSEMEQYWAKYWPAQAAATKAIKELVSLNLSEVDEEETTLIRGSVPSARIEIYKWKKVIKLKRRQKIETEAEKELRFEEQDKKAIRRRIQKGLDLADPQGLADFIKANRQERDSKRGLQKLREELPDEPDFDCIANQQALREIFAGMLADSPNRTCISCYRLHFEYQSQKFKSRAMRELDNLSKQQVDRKEQAARTFTSEEEAPALHAITLKCNQYMEAVASIGRTYEETKRLAVQEPRLYGDPEDPTLRICLSCWRQLKDSRAPKQGSWNITLPEPVPPNLAQLSDLGKQLLSRVIPFMKILALPRGSQRGLKGAVISVPADVDHTITRLLPHDLASGKLVSVCLKKKLVYKSSDKSQLINPETLYRALLELIKINPHYVDVIVKDRQVWSEAVTAQQKDSEASVLEDQESKEAEAREDEAEWEGECQEELESGDAWQNVIPSTCFVKMNGPFTGNINKLAHEKDSNEVANCEPNAPLCIHSQPVNSSRTAVVEEPSKGASTGSGSKFFRRRHNSEAASSALSTTTPILRRKIRLDEQGRAPTPATQAALDAKNQSEGRTRHCSETMPQQHRVARRQVAVAPGENQIPQALWKIPHADELSFPALFPNGNTGAKAERKVKLTTGEFAKNRLTHTDRRFVSCPSWLFHTLHRLQYERLLNSINVSLNKATVENEYGEKINNPTFDVGSEEFTDAFVAKDAGFRFMSQLRGSPAYWKRALYDLLAMCRQIGPPTVFLTLSADDLHWPDVLRPMMESKYKRDVSDEDVANLSGRQRSALLREFPDIAARLFERRVRLFYEKILKHPKTNPLVHKVQDVFYRFEWQARGSPHVHSLLWLEGAPILGRDFEEDFIDLADTIISTEIPDQTLDPELNALVKRVQVHGHRPTCQKLERPRFHIKDAIAAAAKDAGRDLTEKEMEQIRQDAHCRFKFSKDSFHYSWLEHELPRLLRDPVQFLSQLFLLPVLSPRVALQPPSPPQSPEQAPALPDEATTGLLEISEPLELEPFGAETSQDSTATAVSASFLSRPSSLPCADSTQASIAQDKEADEAAEAKSLLELMQSSPVNLHMQRDSSATSVNNYNAPILRLWRSNMDIQLVTNAYTAIQYICAYISKAEKEVGEAMAEVLKNMPEGCDARTRLRKISNAFTDSRSMSAQEAVHQILGLPLLRKSRQVVFLSTGFPKNRHRMLKPKAKLSALPSDAKPADFFLEGLIEKYQKRVVDEESEGWEAVKALTLSQFAAWYKNVNADPESKREEEGVPDEGEELPCAANDTAPSGLPAILKLEGGAIMGIRTRKAVVRYHRFDRAKNEEEFCYSYLVLFYPFVKEEEDLSLEKAGFDSYKEFLLSKKPEMEERIEEFEAYSSIITAAYHELDKAKQEAMQNHNGVNDDSTDGDDARDSDDNDDFDFLDPEDLNLDILDGVGGGESDGGEVADQPGFQAQPLPFHFSKQEILSRLTKIQAALNKDQKASFSKGMGGPSAGTGTGKSFLLKAIRLRVHLSLHEDLEDLTSVVMAPTGTAALNVGGDTIHHALSLPIQQYRATIACQLSDKKLQAMRNKYEKTHCWLIDEVRQLKIN